jgi:hypothetical protein
LTNRMQFDMKINRELDQLSGIVSLGLGVKSFVDSQASDVVQSPAP